MIRYNVDYILSFVDLYNQKSASSPKCKNSYDMILDGGEVLRPNSANMRLFKLRGVKCISCGIEGKYFRGVLQQNNGRYYLCLFALKDRKEVLMTKDHILPKSLGGSNDLGNLQVMCTDCNSNKKDSVIKNQGISKEEVKKNDGSRTSRICHGVYKTSPILEKGEEE